MRQIILLDQWKLVQISGPDSKKYLQEQITGDVKFINNTRYIFTAHCNSYGKVLHVFRIFQYKKGYAYIIKNNLIKDQINVFKKYAIFSKISIDIKKNVTILGLVGENIKNILKKYFKTLPDLNKNIVYLKDNILLYIQNPIERFLLVTNNIQYQNIFKDLIYTIDHNQWLSLEINGGYPIIENQNIQKFFPQYLNLDAIPFSISYNKGCYLGQENIVKVKHKKINNYSMYCLSGICNLFPNIGEEIEFKINSYWKKVGTILSVVLIFDKYFDIQAVIRNKMISFNSIFRIKNQKDSRLKIKI
ncbi:MAG: tRNA-modifying protein YgfZ [Arsenophonus sp.]|nr:MAG: tRNA-modifying protein YgfZ [Arsenophonus sp.]